MTPEQFAQLILGIAGVILQLVIKYLPFVAKWYDGLDNKGLAALILDVIVGAAIFGLSCTPFAADLGISIACETGTVFLLLKAIFILAIGQQGAYLFTRKGAKG